MKIFKKIALLSFVFTAFMILESCAGTRVGAGVGVNVNFGPHGPRVSPSLDVHVYNGGRF